MTKTSYLAAGILALVALGASAQTGRPAEAPSATPAPARAGDDGVGSYARYLMLNGTPRDVALARAKNIDHPATSGVTAHARTGDASAQASVR